MTRLKRGSGATRGTRPAIAGLRVAALWVTVIALSACGHQLPIAGTAPSSDVRGASTPSSTTLASGAATSSGGDLAAAPDVTEDDVLATKLSVPWGVAFLPDGTALVGQRSGAVVRIGSGSGVKKVGTVPGVNQLGEGGLLGLAVDSTGSTGSTGTGSDGTKATVFAYLTSTAGGNRVVKMSWSGSKLGAPKVLLTGIASSTNHNGGALIIGPDGNLWIGTGDGLSPSRAQDRSSLNGKILRITKSGKIPKDNPFKGSPVWSYGHRNVQGLAFDSRNRLWATEFGQDTWDELNRIVMGRNYGWPIVEGKKGRKGFVDPAVQWKTDDASPSGLAIVDDVAYLGALKGKRIWQVPLSETKAGTPVSLFKGDYGRIRNVVLAPDGRLWITTSNRDGRGDPGSDDDRVISLKLG